LSRFVILSAGKGKEGKITLQESLNCEESNGWPPLKQNLGLKLLSYPVTLSQREQILEGIKNSREKEVLIQ
jgi:hypothetical protein